MVIHNGQKHTWYVPKSFTFINVATIKIRTISNTPKLRTYKIFKEIYCTEFYVTSCLNRRQRSTMAKLRCGILPLEIETGRWRSAPVEERLCKLCNDDIENEIHFLFKCNRYTDRRKSFYLEVENKSPGFKNVTDQDKLNVIMSDSIIRCTMKYLQDIWNIRTELMYENV